MESYLFASKYGYTHQPIIPKVKSIGIIGLEQGDRIAAKHYYYYDESNSIPSKNSTVTSISSELSRGHQSERDFEKQLWTKVVHSKPTPNVDTEIITMEISATNSSLSSHTTVYRRSQDLIFFVSGDPQQNELFLEAVLNAFCQSLSFLLNTNVSSFSERTGFDNPHESHSSDSSLSRKEVFSKIDCVFLVLDEMLDQGIVMELDPSVISSRIYGDRSSSSGDEGAATLLKNLLFNTGNK